jgi:hypothetical protein
MQIERDISKFLTGALIAAVIADILTHGSVAVSVGQLFTGTITTALKLAAGQKA